MTLRLGPSLCVVEDNEADDNKRATEHILPVGYLDNEADDNKRAIEHILPVRYLSTCRCAYECSKQMMALFTARDVLYQTREK